ncbi:kinase-like domain-containing protein [Hyaloraphidium curvatum]|nr:kinase-like domain-containing protein [Hyaloraphidium curvatum]
MSPRLRIDPKDLNIDYGAKLGDGGFGEVFAGKLFITTPVAVKIMRARVDDATLRAFEREVTTWESMIHPNVMPLMAYTVSPPMLISPLAVQGNLRKYLAALNWPQPDGIRLLHGVALGMSFLHARGVLHGDLKSLNVLVDAGVARITDFGLARFASWATTSDAGLRGTPAFMSPESFDNDPPRPPADVYAFGMVCYEVVSRGRHPFEEAGSLPVLMRMVLEGQRPARPAGVPDRLWRLMQRCWVEKPEDRPSFVEIVGELGTIIGV